MRLFCLFILIVLPLMMFGCSAVSDSPADVSKEHDVQQERMISELISTWKITQQTDALQQAMTQEYSRWLQPAASIPFVIADTKQGSQEHIGLFQTRTLWEIKGKSNSGDMFKLENNEDNVTLLHGKEQKIYGQEAFQFLLPVQHIEVIQDILQKRNYEFLSWSQAENGWNVEFRSPIDPLEPIFADYWQGHVVDGVEKIDYPFNGFSIWYTLQLRELEGGLVLKSIYFSLIKNEEVLDTLFFIL